MIISASRRTDIPALYSDWLINRVRAGWVMTANPLNPRQIRRIDLSPEAVDGIVFWTKNPLPMLEQLQILREYTYYFQFTLTPYDADAEPGLPHKEETLIPAFQRLADMIGPERVIWRYDPIFLSEKYTADYHAAAFDHICDKLNGYSKCCIISFLDDYRHIRGKVRLLKAREPSEHEIDALAGCLAESARTRGMTLETCAEAMDLQKHGIGHARCVDVRLLERLKGKSLEIGRDKNQRLNCGCAASVDIGAYDTCTNGCLYCYAGHSDVTIRKNHEQYDADAPGLCQNRQAIASNEEIK